MERTQRDKHTGERMRRGHVIDLLFPIALFLVLAASSLFLVILAANTYRKSVMWEESNYESRTCLSYVTEKIRQGDERGAVETGTFDGIPCLIFRQNFGAADYVTYLYSYEGRLCELFVQEGVSVRASDGQGILDVNGLSITEPEKGVFRISCLDDSGRESVTYAAVKSKA